MENVSPSMATVVGCRSAGNVVPPTTIWDVANDTRTLPVVTSTTGPSSWGGACGEICAGGVGKELCPFGLPGSGEPLFGPVAPLEGLPLLESPAGGDGAGFGGVKGLLKTDAMIPPRSTKGGGCIVGPMGTFRSWVGFAASGPVWIGWAGGLTGPNEGGVVSPIKTVCVCFNVVTTSGLGVSNAVLLARAAVSGWKTCELAAEDCLGIAEPSATVVVCRKVIQWPVPEHVQVEEVVFR